MFGASPQEQIKAVYYHSWQIMYYPNDDTEYYSRGNAYYSLGHYSEAADDYTKAIELNPEFSYSYYYGRGNAYYNIGQYSKAIDDYTKALKFDFISANAIVYYNRGEAYGILGQHDNANADYAKAKELEDSYDMDKKPSVIQWWKENGINADFLKEYVNSVNRHEVLHRRQKVSVRIPVDEDFDKGYGEIAQFSLFPEEADMSYDEQLVLCFSRIYYFMKEHTKEHWYLLEAAVDSLPAWSDSYLPDRIMKHILKNHTRNGRIGFELDDSIRESSVKHKFSLSNREFAAIKTSLPKRLEAGAPLNRKEEQIVGYLLESSKKDLFPHHMSERQLAAAIKHAYENAKIAGRCQMSTPRDAANAGWTVNGAILYQGQARDLTIRFWFDFDENEIVTAYPA